MFLQGYQLNTPAFWYNKNRMIVEIDTPEARHSYTANCPCHLSWETDFCQPPMKQLSVIFQIEKAY